MRVMSTGGREVKIADSFEPDGELLLSIRDDVTAVELDAYLSLQDAERLHAHLGRIMAVHRRRKAVL